MRNFPVKFYKKQDGTIHYENAFIREDAKDLNQAFNNIRKIDWFKELVYYMEDVTDVQIGSFQPAYRDRKYKGMLYLGKLDFKLEIDTGWGTGEHSITHLQKNPQDLEKHNKYVSKLKRQEKVDKFVGRIKDGIKKFANTVGIREMYDPLKTRKDLICDYCGEIIPTGTYYEELKGKSYHLECIWAKSYSDIQDKRFYANINNYEDAKQYFHNLSKFIGKWPFADMPDDEEEYLSDLELIKSNERRSNLNKNSNLL